MANIINAAPMVIDEGTRDASTRQLPASPLQIPQHLPLVYLFAEKGPVGRHYVDMDNESLTGTYGDKTFDITSKYFGHTTPFAQTFAAAANNFVVHRLVAPDAKDVANIGLYLDVLETEVIEYVKGADGSILTDEQGEPVPVMIDDGGGTEVPKKVPGYKVAWVVKNTVANVGEYQPGLLTIENNGLQSVTTQAGEVQSKQYPIFEFAVADQGEAGNRLAVKLFPSLQTDVTPFPGSLLQEGKMYPLNFGMVKLMDEITGSVNPILNSLGSQSLNFVAKPDGMHPSTGATMDLGKITRDMYINVERAYASGLGVAHTYEDNLETVLGLLYDAEKNLTDEHRDSVINNEEDNRYAINFVTFTSSNGSPYKAIEVVNVPGTTRITKNTNLFMTGSDDGTITTDLLDTLVAADLDNYNSSLHEYNDLVAHPESILYDSGFSFATKKAFPKMIAHRKDTFVVLSTYAHNEPNTTIDQHYSSALALKTMLELYPESATFGTSVMRGMVVGGSGYMVNSLYAKRTPLTYEIAYKAARYMGAKDGAWKNGFVFDAGDAAVIGQLKDLDVTWVPASTRNTLWSAGLVFCLNFSIREQFIPALQTIYENDTSVLNSFFTAVAISYLNKINHAAWRQFSGSTTLSNAQLEARVDDFIAERVKDKFDNMFIIKPETTVTEDDAIRGYSWHSNIKIYAPNMKTVAVARVTAYRIEDAE